ncbi:hypothetical protein DNR46_03400 [Mesorhizobium japonicum]|uniref:Cyanobacterial TRADD-N associated 2 transmembrane domain-containing protein n=1 Tax=Mesorhizobium japonicum TaxID=2066070 RepID=A0A3M9XGQ2_9HYPH|nr:hypothetical protein DNR46_03400 [Mesorhizobium japonicum]
MLLASLAVLFVLVIGVSVINFFPVTYYGVRVSFQQLFVPVLVTLFPALILFIACLLSFQEKLPIDMLENGTISASFLGYRLSVGTHAPSSRRRQRAAAVSAAEAQATKSQDIMDDINLSLAQLVEYYVINKGQAKSSFRVSLMAIVVGFVTIIAGVWLSYTGQLENQNPAYLSVLAGVIFQFIGGAYFYLYSRSLIQLNFFFSRLAMMQDTMLAVRLCETLPEGRERNSVLERLIFMIVSRDPKVPQYLAEEKTARAKPEPKAKPVPKAGTESQ